MTWYQRLCPHWFGWSYNTYGRRRWCRLCALQQRVVALDHPADVKLARRLVEDGDELAAQRFILSTRRWIDA